MANRTQISKKHALKTAEFKISIELDEKSSSIFYLIYYPTESASEIACSLDTVIDKKLIQRMVLDFR